MVSKLSSKGLASINRRLVGCDIGLVGAFWFILKGIRVNEDDQLELFELLFYIRLAR